MEVTHECAVRDCSKTLTIDVTKDLPAEWVVKNGKLFCKDHWPSVF